MQQRTLEQIERGDGINTTRLFAHDGAWCRIARVRQSAPDGCTLRTGEDHVLILDLTGTRGVRRKIGARRQEGDVPAGDVTTMVAGQQNEWGFARNDLFQVYLPASRLSREAEAAGRAAPKLRDETGLDDPLGAQLLRTMLTAAEAGTPDPLLLDTMGLAVTRHLMSRYAKPQDAHTPADRARIARANAYIDAHLASALSLDAIATATGASASWLTAAFKAQTGHTVWQHVQAKRIAHARALLTDRTLSIAQIAHRTGFSSQSHLTRSFKALTGMTPAQFRRRA